MTIAPSVLTFSLENGSRDKGLDRASMSPDERVFRDHVAGTRFLEGVERGRWRIVDDIEWPVALVAVSAAPRENAPTEYFLRFDLSGYPETAPTATPWNPNTEEVLQQELRPKGTQSGPRIPCRLGKRASPLRSLRPSCTRLRTPTGERSTRGEFGIRRRILTWILQKLHEMLSNDDYTGV